MDFKIKSFLQLVGVLYCLCEYLLARPAEPAVQQQIPDEVRKFYMNPRFRWSYGKIPYVISSLYSDSERAIIVKAMKEWESKTCVRFVPNQSANASYVEITPNDDAYSYCYSHVGRRGGRQIMKVFGDCIRNGTMLHELGHLIGFNYEHQRPDRDDYISVHYENIEPAFNFTYERLATVTGETIGTNYDFASVMHYPFFAYAKVYDEKRPAMTLKDGTIHAIYREAEYLSATDIYKTQLYYQNCTVAFGT